MRVQTSIFVAIRYASGRCEQDGRRLNAVVLVGRLLMLVSLPLERETRHALWVFRSMPVSILSVRPGGADMKHWMIRMNAHVINK